MMLAVALALLVTVSFAVTTNNFEFVLPDEYAPIQEKPNIGVYQKEGTILMYAVKSVYDKKSLEVLKLNTEELITLIKDMYGETSPIIESKRTVSLKNCEAVRVNLTNEMGTKSILFFANSDSAIILLVFSGEVLDEDEINSVLHTFEVKGFNKQSALVVVVVVVIIILLLIVISKVKKK